ncbi:MAG: type II toxin-antitoxin system VapC family toxin [Desulfobacterales bacterium]|nr:type II toxin-antitoxin system VapC family toxin [Desulfobacterales bacterium]
MNLLLDTHVLLWWLDDNPTLAEEAKHAISNRGNFENLRLVTRDSQIQRYDVPVIEA